MVEDKGKDAPTKESGQQNRQKEKAQTSSDAQAQTPAPQQSALDAAREIAPDASELLADSAERTREGAEVFEIAVLPLQQTTLFPGTVVPLAAGRPRSIAAVEAALATEEKLLACITVREGRGGPEGEATPPADLYEVGTLVMVKRMMRSPDGLHLIVHGTERVRVVKWTQTDPHIRARVRIIPPPVKRDEETVEALLRNVQSLVQRALALLPEIPPEIRSAILSSNDPMQLAYFLGSILNLGVEQEQQMLEADYIEDLLQIAHSRLAREIEIMEIRSNEQGAARLHPSPADEGHTEGTRRRRRRRARRG
jgi:ATP-dependent Lon protease